MPEGTKSERVLLVEDQHSLRLAMSKLIETLNYDVAAAGSVQEALGLSEEPAFDVLLTDLMLPDGSGVDLARQLEVRWHGLKVILLSGYALDEIQARGRPDSHFHILTKPVTREALGVAIRSALDGKITTRRS